MEKRTSAQGAVLLIAGGVVAAIVLLGVFVLPVQECPPCTWDFFGPFEKWDVHKLESLRNNCETCGGRRKVSLFKRWNLKRIEALR
jgi:hypothetical protein